MNPKSIPELLDADHRSRYSDHSRPRDSGKGGNTTFNELNVVSSEGTGTDVKISSAIMAMVPLTI